MKRFTIIPLALAALLTLSCQKNIASVDAAPQEIVLTISDAPVEVFTDTKATPVTAIPSTLYWGATTGSGAESVTWAAASATVSSGKISTGKYQTATPTAYNYYVANRTFTAGGTMSVPNNSIDIVAGRTASSTLTFPSVTLNHIFARTGTLTLNVPAGYTATSVSWRIKSKGAVSGTAGTYDMKLQSWSAASTALSDQAFTGSSDLWVIPGTYTVTVSFTLTKGAFTKAYTQAGDVTLVAGKQNNITATTINDEATPISLGVSLAPWEREITDGITKHEYPSFGGVNIAPGPLLYTGTDFVIQPSWKIGSNSIGRLTGAAGSVYLRYEQLGKYFSSQGNAFTLGSGLGIDNQGNNMSYNGYDGWRMPTYSEYDKIINGPRTGSSVDGTPGCRYAFVKVTGYNFDNMGDPFYGLLLFPDNVDITTPAGGISCNTTAVQQMSISLLNYIINKGCVFLPACGSRNPTEAAWRGIGTICYYHCATSSGTSSIYCLQADNGIVSINELIDHPEAEYMPIRLVRNAE